MDTIPRVSIIVLNWNGWKDTIECLESLSKVTYHSYDIVIVDNHSRDGSVSKIWDYCKALYEESLGYHLRCVEFDGKEYYEIPRDTISHTLHQNAPKNRHTIALVKSNDNYGFAGGNNIGIRYALDNFNPSYLLLLNNDTIVDASFLDLLVSVGESNESIALLGPKILYNDYNGRKDVIWFAGGKINYWFGNIYTHLSDGEPDSYSDNHIKEVDWLSGCALLMKVTSEMPLLNSRYFFGFEDVEYCIKAKKRGKKIIFVPSSRIWHKIGMSRKKTKPQVNRLIYKFRFIKENFPAYVFCYRLLILCIIFPIWCLNYLVMGVKYKWQN